MKKILLIITIFNLLTFNTLYSQIENKQPFFSTPDTLNKKRLKSLLTVGSLSYATSFAILYKVWYANGNLGKFNFFDDNGEWLLADKIGHSLTAYNESKWAYETYRWTGMSKKKAAWAGMAAGMLFQTTFEVMDGFSTDYGFSLGDMVANTSGCALFGIQQAVWEDQRITFKVGNFPKNYDKTLVPVYNETTKKNELKSVYTMARSSRLYGETYPESFFKDYNAINWWLSINPKSFVKNKNSKFPAWLNIAVGYSAENVFGAYYNLAPANTDVYPRYRQYLLSLDVDLSRIPTKSKFLKTVFKALNFVKIPAPALEYNSLGQFKFHPIIF
jgi:Predicted periplasmic lipoprotein (DUF2279)